MELFTSTTLEKIIGYHASIQYKFSYIDSLRYWQQLKLCDKCFIVCVYACLLYTSDAADE